MAGVLSSVFGAGAQFFTNAGVVLAGGKLFTYLAGTTTPLATWTSSAQSVQNSNPIILDSAGRTPNEIWLQNGTSYKIVLTDAAGGILGTFDAVPGVNSTTSTLTEWVPGPNVTYTNATTFTVAGNVIATFQVARRVQYSLTGGTYYGTVASSTYDGIGTTTVVITPDTTGLDSSVVAVNYGFMSAVNTSVPAIYVTAISPVLTGTPIAPTAALGTATTQIATTAFAQTMQSPTFSGVPTAPTPASNVNTVQLVTGQWVNTYFAQLASPTFTGTPSGPTPGSNINTTQFPTTAWVNTWYAPLLSPAFGGTPTAPTPTAGDNSTRVATTAFAVGLAFASALPAQGGNAGKFVTTDGAVASWQAVPQTGQALYLNSLYGAF